MSVKRISPLLIVFIAGLLLSQFIIWPWYIYPFELPRVWFVHRWIEILLLTGVVFGIPHLNPHKEDSPLIMSVLIFFLIATFTALIGIDPIKSFWGNYYRNDGLFNLLHLVGLFFFLSLFWRVSWQKPIVTVFAIGCIGNAVFALIVGVVNNHLPLIGSFGHANFLAGYLAVTAPFVLWRIRISAATWKKALWTAGFCLVSIALGLTFSVGGLVGLSVVGLTIILGHRGISHKKIFFVLIVLAVLAACGFFIKESTRSSFNPESRNRIVARALIASTARPLTGWGWSNFDYAFDQTPWPIKLQHDRYIDKAHSQLLEILVTTGIIGLLVYLGIIGRVVWRFAREREISIFLFAAFAAYIIHTQTNVFSISEELIFWIIAGQIASHITTHKVEDQKK